MGKITFNGTTAQTIPANIFTVNTVKDVEFNNVAGVSLGGPLNIQSGSSAGSVTVKAGTFKTNNFLTIKSDIDGTGRIAENNTGNTYLTGNVTVERFIPAHKRRAYRLLAPSVTTTTTVRDNWQEGVNVDVPSNSSAFNPKPGYGTHITGSTIGANGFDATLTGNPSMYGFVNGGNYFNVSNTNSLTLNAKTGYMLFMRGDRERNNITSNTQFSPSTTLRATGTIAMGDQSYDRLQTTGFNLVTNPYAAPIDWAKVHNDNTGLDLSYIYFDGSIGMRGGYVSVDKDGNPSIITTGLTGNLTSNANLNIQSGQAFFVKSNSQTSMTIKESHKSDVSNVQVFRNQRLYSSLYFTFDNNRVLADGVSSIFDDAYSKEVDGNDAPDLANFDENIAINRAGRLLSIESRPLINVSDTIPFALARLRATQYTWQFDPVNFTGAGMTAYLVDKYLNKRTPIDLLAKTLVDFQVSSDAASSAADRFMIVIEAPKVLPIDAITVQAVRQGDKVKLDWQVQTETNMKEYEVQGSADGRSFESVGTVKATGNISLAALYSYQDAQPGTAEKYYRVKAVGNAGEVKYSSIVKVNALTLKGSITMYPNPVSLPVATLKMTNIEKGKYTIVVYDQAGKLIKTLQFTHPGGSLNHSLNFDRLAAGIYQLQVISTEGITYSLRFNKK